MQTFRHPANSRNARFIPSATGLHITGVAPLGENIGRKLLQRLLELRLINLAIIPDHHRAPEDLPEKTNAIYCLITPSSEIVFSRRKSIVRLSDICP